MKPLHIGLLIAAAAVGGAMFVKVTQSPQPAPAPVVAESPIPAAPIAQPEPAVTPPVVEEKKPEVSRPGRRLVLESRPKPAKTEVAQNTPPASPQVTPAPTPTPAPAAPEPVKETPSPILKPDPEQAPPPPRKVTVAAGTTLQVRLVEGLSTDRNQAGDTFTATLDAPLVVDGLVIAERGSRLEGRVVESEKAGRVRGVSSMAIELTQLTTSDGQHIRLQTDSFNKEGEKSVGKDAAKVGAAAGIGAAIGAIAGGGKGAGIGA